MDGLDVQTVAFWHLHDWPDLLRQGPGSCTGPSKPVSFHFSGDVNCCVDRQSWAGPSEPTCNRQQTPECSGLRHGVWPRIWSKKNSAILLGTIWRIWNYLVSPQYLLMKNFGTLQLQRVHLSHLWRIPRCSPEF